MGRRALPFLEVGVCWRYPAFVEVMRSYCMWSSRLSKWLGAIFWAMGWTLMLSVSGAHAHDGQTGSHVLQRLEWKLDATGQANWQQMAATDGWATFEGSKGWGFGAGTVWVRYTLRAALPGERDLWAVKVSPLFLERLTLYDPAAALELEAGFAVNRSKDSLDSVNFMFPVPALNQPRELYLRLQTSSTRMVFTDALPLRQAVRDNKPIELLFASLWFLSLVFAVWSLLQWWISRDRVMGAFALKQWVATVWASSWTGTAFLVLGHGADAAALWDFFLWVRVLTIAASAWFLLTLIQEYRPAAVWVRINQALILAVLGLPLLQLWSMPVRMYSNLLTIAVMLALVGAMMSSVRTWRLKAALPRAFVLTYLLILTAVNIPPLLMNLGAIPAHPLVANFNLSHVFLDGFVMFLLLQLRSRRLLRHAKHLADRRQRVAMRIRSAEEKAVEERQRREEQSQFLHMLMHELKTPLSVVALALGSRSNREEGLAQAGRAVQDMKAIIERCVMADQPSEPTLVIRPQDLLLPDLVQEQATGIGALDHRFELVVPAGVPSVRSDLQLVKIILANLLGNAASYSDPHTHVTAVLVEDDHQGRQGVSLRVRNVPGLAGWPDAQRLFQKYYRATGALRQSGSGLGLFLSRQLAQSLGGRLSYEPDDRHVEFVLWIPRQPL